MSASNNQADSKPKTYPEDSKWGIRKKVWDKINNEKLANFPLPVYHRIPNVKTSGEASRKAAELDVFKNAKVIKINTDKPQEQARLSALQANKTVLVPTPGKKTGLLSKIVPPADTKPDDLKPYAQALGMGENSQTLELDEVLKIDLIIIGSCCVSEQGYRLGKGEGYGDLEYAMMLNAGYITRNTPVVTIVDEVQIQEIPSDILEEQDVTVDYIVLPDKIIETKCPKPKPSGIIWSKLTERYLERIPVLQLLREKDEKKGVDVKLGEVDPEPRPKFTPPRRNRRPYNNQGGKSEKENNPRQRPRPRRRPNQTNTSVYVGGLPRSLRVSEFKKDIHDRDVQPLRVVWHGSNGHAFLQFQKQDEAESALQALQNLNIKGRDLKVEKATGGRRSISEKTSESHDQPASED
ncbi:hypothetical protein LOTGIDRAFT_224471 [Lottia gigantea]|uniref:Methenyltetrahydrofolate synthase domain-containing protein n=1 Tax=Lottia gigantea TaxID=225164 RepID=V4AHC0_LOTGI|nr:hypothetical protein LOTGIDRAFT_224471 [Lottia gigantea]ESP03424.1 hypothetical protein LOTGIDRAFT_224471 [Lottia gigantea]